MDQRTITREITDDDLCAALELLYRSMGLLNPREEISSATFGTGKNRQITFTISKYREGVENISIR